MIPGRPPETCQSKQRRNGWLETSASSTMLVSGGDVCVLVTWVSDEIVLRFPCETSWQALETLQGAAANLVRVPNATWPCSGRGVPCQPGCWVPHPEPNSECPAGRMLQDAALAGLSCGMLLGWNCRLCRNILAAGGCSGCGCGCVCRCGCGCR